VATNKERRPSVARERCGREMVSAPEDREVNVRWTFGECQRGEAPMEITPKGLSCISGILLCAVRKN